MPGIVEKSRKTCLQLYSNGEVTHTHRHAQKINIVINAEEKNIAAREKLGV